MRMALSVPMGGRRFAPARPLAGLRCLVPWCRAGLLSGLLFRIAGWRGGQQPRRHRQEAGQQEQTQSYFLRRFHIRTRISCPNHALCGPIQARMTLHGRYPRRAC